MDNRRLTNKTEKKESEYIMNYYQLPKQMTEEALKTAEQQNKTMIEAGMEAIFDPKHLENVRKGLNGCKIKERELLEAFLSIDFDRESKNKEKQYQVAVQDKLAELREIHKSIYKTEKGWNSVRFDYNEKKRILRVNGSNNG